MIHFLRYFTMLIYGFSVSTVFPFLISKCPLCSTLPAVNTGTQSCSQVNKDIVLNAGEIGVCFAGASGEAFYIGIPAHVLYWLQTIQKAAARLNLNILQNNHIFPHLNNLHWFPVQEGCKFKLITHAFKALPIFSPAYLNHCLNFYQPTRHLRSASQVRAHLPHIN